MPFTDVIRGSAVSFTPFSRSHLTESAALATAGFVGFFALKRPLGWLAHHMPDVDTVTHPAAFHAGRGAVRGVTELWVAVDRLAMEAAGVTMRTATHPREALSRVGVDTEIRTGIGRSVLFLTLAAGAVLFVLLLG